MRLIDVLFVLDLLDADAHAVPSEDDVLLAHALRGRVADGLAGKVYVVADPGRDAKDYEDDDEGEELAVFRTTVSNLVILNLFFFSLMEENSHEL